VFTLQDRELALDALQAVFMVSLTQGNDGWLKSYMRIGGTGSIVEGKRSGNHCEQYQVD
jgi:hypothetical protein